MDKDKSDTDSNETEKLSLRRVLGLATSTLLVAGLMIGSGAFKKIAPMARSLGSETYIIWAWIIAGIITLFGAFTYAGLAQISSRTGGIYEYLQIAFGDFTAFLFGWSFFTITGSGAIAALTYIFSESVNTIIPLPFGGIRLFAVVVIALLTWLNCLGIKQGGIVNSIVTVAKIGGIAILIIASLFFHSPSTETVVPPVSSLSLSGGALLSAFLGAMLSALWAYDGWANITFIAGEIKNPARNLPIAITLGVGIAMLLYVLLNYGFMQVLSVSQLSSIGTNQIAATEVAGVILGRAGAVVIALLIMVCTFGAANASIIVYPRLYFRMAEGGRFFKQAATVHRRFRTPVVALIYSGVWSSVLVLSGTFDLLTNLVVLASYFFFGLTAWGLIKLKRNGLITAKVTGYPFTPLIIIIFSGFLMINNIIREPMQSLACFLLVLSGIPFYAFFKWKEKGTPGHS